MLAILFDILVVLQSAVQGDGSGGAGAPAGGGGGAANGAAPQPGMGGATQLIFIVGMFAVMYFIMIRPQQKRAREQEEFLKSLKKGAIVRTSGGIRGEIFDINDREAVLIIADKVKINVLRNHIAGAESDQTTVPVVEKA